jgi:hypothetical protein
MIIKKEVLFNSKGDTLITNNHYFTYTFTDKESGYQFTIYSSTENSFADKLTLGQILNMEFDLVLSKQGKFKLKFPESVKK